MPGSGRLGAPDLISIFVYSLCFWTVLFFQLYCCMVCLRRRVVLLWGPFRPAGLVLYCSLYSSMMTLFCGFHALRRDGLLPRKASTILYRMSQQYCPGYHTKTVMVEIFCSPAAGCVSGTGVSGCILSGRKNCT
ncbi:unnamed protein product [Pylaiella littoralis]